jgi:predicted transcriptional regulator/plasmid stabilization system protein ParE
MKLDAGIKLRLRRLADARRRSSHWLMREAIEQYVDREERREKLRQDALAAWAGYQATGRHVTAAEADAWLARLEAGRNAKPPRPHRWSVPQLIWTPPALHDVARLHGFLESKDPDAARRAVRAIRRGVKTLAAYPEIGRPVEEMEPEFREWFIHFGDSGYVVLYRCDGGMVAILAVRHGKEAGYLGDE